MKIKKSVSLFLACTIICLVFSACSSSNGPSYDSTISLADIKTAVTDTCNMDDVSFTPMADDDGNMILSLNYGISADLVSTYIEDYLISVPSAGVTSQTLALFRLKDEAISTSGIVDMLKSCLIDTYVEEIKSSTKLYDSEQYALAEAYTIEQYDTLLVLTIYDNEGNTAVTNAIVTAISK